MKNQKSKIKNQNNKLKVKSYCQGQTILLVLLVITVVLTIALSLITRSITDVSMSRKIEETNRAFSAAEAGIEESLRLGGVTLSSSNLSNNTSYQVTSTRYVNLTEFVFPTVTDKDEASQIFLSSYPAYNDPYTGTNITVYWGNAACGVSTQAALSVDVIYGEATPFSVKRYAVDPCGRGNGFSNVVGGGGTVGGNNFQFSKTIDLTGLTGLKFARVRAFYAKTQLGVKNDGTAALLPDQGTLLTSQGQIAPTPGAGSSVVRTVKMYLSHPVLPGIFDYVFYSGAAVTK